MVDPRGSMEVQEFGELMIAKLNTERNRAKGDWTNLPVKFLRFRLKQERKEVDEILDYYEIGEATLDEVFAELADEANFLMMLHDVLRRDA